MTAPPPSPARPGPLPYSATKLRTVAVAFDLFAAQGVGATSLQMIADALGVTKAAVYHQFKTKDEIALAVAEVELARLEAAVEAAEAAEPGPVAQSVLLDEAITLTVARPRMVSLLQNDPAMVRLVATHPPFRLLMGRLFAILTGDHPSDEARVQTAMVSAALAGAVVHPLVAGLDDDVLRDELLRMAHRLFEIPAAEPGS